jgi:hypothetical protein
MRRADTHTLYQTTMPLRSAHTSPYVTPHILHKSYAQADHELFNSSLYLLFNFYVYAFVLTSCAQ